FDFAMQQRFAAGDHHHGRAALLHCLHAFIDGQALVEDLRRVIDLAATGTGQVAAEQRLEHQHQRVALPPQQMLLHDIGADTQRLVQRHGHSLSILYASANSLGKRKRTSSATPASVDTSIAPNWRSPSRTPWTSISGADAPAVTP